jgi:hypothetical protein
MRHLRLFASVVLLIVAWCPSYVGASGLSDITGIDINIPGGTITFGTPRIDRIPQVVQNLPKDVGVFLLNPLAGGGLAFAIRQAKEEARGHCVPMPPQVTATLSAFFPPDLFPSVCWAIVGNGTTLDSYAIRDFGMAAITLEDVVVFRSQQDGSDPVLWSHELTHVLQYRRLGVEAFAAIYASPGFDALEQEARQFDQFVARRLQETGTQHWQTAPGWNQQITTQQWAMAARSAVNPLQCSWSTIQTNALGSWLVQINNCPIPIKVMQVKYVNPQNGFPVNYPCGNPNCFVPAMTQQNYPLLQWLRYVGMDIVWQ